MIGISLFLGITNYYGQENNSHFFFKQNKGQWNSKVQFKADLSEGAMFLENQGITYHFVDKTYLRESHGKSNVAPPESINGHVVRVKFKNSNPQPLISKTRKAPHYENYFIGNDSSKWASNVGIYNEVYYSGVYNNIDFKIYEASSNMKYDFIVKPGGDPKNIKIEYKGADEMFIENEILYVKTSLTDIIENKPFAYQFINGEKTTVPCKFKLKRNKLTFDFPDGYDKNEELVIDPFLVFSTYSGAVSDNWGHTATYDTLGYTYAAGVIFGVSYPTTTGSYDTSFNGGSAPPFAGFPSDIAVTKFNLNGSALMYSTFIGGSGDEAPHSLVTNGAGELYILGTTGSSNYPTTTGCYDGSFNGGSAYTNNPIDFPAGCDIIISRLNTTGSILLASTYMGGTGNDGLNNVTGLNNNYADEFRGEIILDASSNCYIASTTHSTNFPVVNGLTSRGGTSDGIVFKLNPTLTTLIWSTHIGGSGNDAAYGIQRDALGNTFVAGGTSSTNLSSAQNSNSGGIDGFLAKYSSTNALLTSRYIGTSSYDQCYFVQVDITDSVYVFGQSAGSMPVTAGKYNNTGSHQFVQKFNNTINTLNFSTVIGTGGTTIDISPSAFLVNDCGLIYLSGWGGTVNNSGSTTGLPVTAGAYQTTTTGSDFYLMVLDKNASGLNYATFFGGSVSAEHVDGGTSRFDKKGNVYQAVCAGCGGRNDFPTSTGAWSTTNGSSNCNLGVFKFNINEIKASASIPSVIICYPNAAVFSNNSVNGNTYHWDFGDGNSSTAFSPTHSYGAAGNYTVILTVSDSTGCIKPDTASIVLTVYDPVAAVVTPDTLICPGSTVQLQANGGTSYKWSPSATLSNDTISNPIASPSAVTTYRVIVTNPCGADTSYVKVGFHTITTTTSNDTTICIGDTAQLNATGGGTYSWSPSARMISPNTQNPLAFPNVSTKYYTNIITPEGCPALDSVFVTVINIPQPVLTDDDSICFGDSKILFASGADSYLWYPSKDLSSSSGTSVTASPGSTITYYVDFTNQCATITDSVTIIVITPEALSSPDDTICFNSPITIWASGGVSYLWSPSTYLTNPTNDTTDANPLNPTLFRVIVTDAIGCTDTAYTRISFSPIPWVNAGADQIINFGQTANLSATSSAGTFSWTPHTSIASTINKNTTAQPSNTTSYIANLLDDYGCMVSDTVVIALDGSIYIPNSFSPNGDGINDNFVILGEDITQFKIMIFNRWGEKLYESNSIDKTWDGTYKGKLSKTDTYVWRIVYSDVNTSRQEVIGHVNLLR